MKFRCASILSIDPKNVRQIRVEVDSPDIEDIVEYVADEVLEELGPQKIVAHFGTEKLLAQMDKDEVLEYFNAVEQE